MTREAAANGAQFVLTPEYALMMDGSGRIMRERALDPDGAPALAELQSLARESGSGCSWARSRCERRASASRTALICSARTGEVVATYDKIHMFDCVLPDGKVIRESSAYRPGTQAVVADTPWGKLGLTVCYDLRFPQLYRALAKAGASYLTIPSSFQRITGKAHWHTLLKARAIENACFVFAPAMCGEHPGNRTTYGHIAGGRSVGRSARRRRRSAGHRLRGGRSGACRGRAADAAVPRARSGVHGRLQTTAFGSGPLASPCNM